MSNKRVAAGNITIDSTDTKGFFVSQHGDHVTSFTKPLEFHSSMASSMHVFYYTQGTIAAPTASGSIPNATYVDITHNWGNNGGHGNDERPLFAVRWSRPSDISSGVATQCYPPNQAAWYEQTEECEGEEEEEDCTQEESENHEGCSVAHLNKNQIRIYNQNLGFLSDYGRVNGDTIYYALVVFYEYDWTGGAGL